MCLVGVMCHAEWSCFMLLLAPQAIGLDGVCMSAYQRICVL